MGDKMEIFEVQDMLENYQQDINELKSTIHACLEGIRTESLGAREIVDTVAMLYKMMGIMAQKLECVRKAIKQQDSGM